MAGKKHQVDRRRNRETISDVLPSGAQGVSQFCKEQTQDKETGAAGQEKDVGIRETEFETDKGSLGRGATPRQQACDLDWGKLKTAEEIFRQQLEMYVTRSCRIKDRIVSFCRPWVRPIKRGKNGKDVEFGAKAAMSHVDGFLFLDEINHGNFSESEISVVKGQIEKYEERFGKKPPSFTGDKAYGSRANREFLEDLGIRTSFVRLGKKQKGAQKMDRWFKRKQKERNRIEGHFGHGKEHYRLNRMWYHGRSGSEIWTRYGILAMNLAAALKRT